MPEILPCPALAYIPQRPPFVLVDELLEVTDMRTVTAFTVPDGHVLCEDAALSAEGLVENMAQTAAAGAGFRAAGSGGARVGFIGAVKNLVVQQLPSVGVRIRTGCEVRHVVGNATIVACSVQDAGGAAIAGCELTIFLEESGGGPA